MQFALIGENLSVNFFSCVKDCIVDVVTFTALVKIYPSKITTIQR